MKGCGKSAPRGWQQSRHGKPHQEQNRIGMSRPAGLAAPGRRIRAAIRVGCTRHSVTNAVDEWPSIATKYPWIGLWRGQNPAYKPSGAPPFSAYFSLMLSQKLEKNITPTKISLNRRIVSLVNSGNKYMWIDFGAS